MVGEVHLFKVEVCCLYVESIILEFNRILIQFFLNKKPSTLNRIRLYIYYIIKV